MKKISVIVPFLNEQEEVKNTIKSILEFSDGDVEIIIINDASDDGYNYISSLDQFEIKYIENKIRKGVADSRNIGVGLSSTPYLLLLDAHMRFYEKGWVDKIVNVLKETPKNLLCCQTKILKKDKNNIIREHYSIEPIGASVDLHNINTLFSPKWITSRKNVDSEKIVTIPCVLGAAYACSKAYWQNLHGLAGLLCYGFDEPYLSIKVWLSGGECKLLRDIVIGHIYRDAMPYQNNSIYYTYNQILLNKLLTDNESYKKYLTGIRSNPKFTEAYLLTYTNRKIIHNLRESYLSIFVKNFSFFKQINREFGDSINEVDNRPEILGKIANHLILKCQAINDLGLMNGRIGVIIFLFHYIKHVRSSDFESLVNDLFDSFCLSLSVHQSFYFQSGLSGIGWAIEYLHQQHFIDGDINELLEDIDDKVLEININRVKDLNLNTGLGGIICYILSRLYSIEKNNLSNPFGDEFLHLLYLRAKSIIDNEVIDTDCIDIFIRYIMYYEQEIILEQSNIYDIIFLRYPMKYQIDNFPVGLNGSAGIGLKLILEKDFFYAKQN